MGKKVIQLRKQLAGRAAIFALCAVAMGALSIAAFALLANIGERNLPRAAMLTVVIYAAGLILSALIVRLSVKPTHGARSRAEIEVLDNITVSFLYAMGDPIAVCATDGKIVLHNDAFAAITGGRDMVGHNISEMLRPSVMDLASAGEEGMSALFGNHHYSVRGYTLSTPSKKYCITLWHDKSEIAALKTRVKNELPCAMFISIDNMDELLRFSQSGHRAMATTIEHVMQEYAAQYRGVLREYERDKYMLIFESRHLPDMVRAKFDLLDRVRSVKVGEGTVDISATVSIGVSGITADLQERVAAAESSLEMAVARGGDQAVYKTDTEVEFFGGVSKTTQKRGAVKARVQATELSIHVKAARNVIIMGHRHADFDSFGACLGAARLALANNKRVSIIANANDPNLARCFRQIAQLDIAPMFTDAASSQERLQSDTLLIVVDVNNAREVEAPALLAAAQKIIYIDHHRQTAEFEVKPLLSYIEPAASSTCELITEMIEQSLGASAITREEAEIMLAGIQLDTKYYTQNCGVRTFAAAQFLRGTGVKMTAVQSLFAVSAGDFTSQSRFTENITTYRGSIAIAVNARDDCTAEDRIVAAKVADKLLTIEGVSAAFALCRIGNAVRISARSDSTVNVQLILEKLGGGGHFNAAATEMKETPLADALTRLKRAIDEYYSDRKGETTQLTINN